MTDLSRACLAGRITNRIGVRQWNEDRELVVGHTHIPYRRRPSFANTLYRISAILEPSMLPLSPSSSPTSQKRHFSFIALILGLVTIICLSGSTFLIRQRQQFLAASREAQGIVIDHKATQHTRTVDGSRDHNGRIRYHRKEIAEISYHPIVEFTDARGNTIRFTSESGSNPPNHAQGETVSVRYIPDHPEKAEINDFLSLWMGALLLGVFGVALLAATIFAYYVDKDSSMRLKSGEEARAEMEAIIKEMKDRMATTKEEGTTEEETENEDEPLTNEQKLR